MPEIQMPKLSDTMTEGTLVAWKKKKGDQVSTGDVIAEIETDKATMEWESPEDGVLSEIYVAEGGKVEVGQKIAFIGAKGEAAPAAKEEPAKPKEEQAETEMPAPAEAKAPETAPPQEGKQKTTPPAPPPSSGAERKGPRPSSSEGTESGRVKASPLARRVAAENGVDIASVKGTGPEGRVTETDVRTAMKAEGGAS